ncbi:MAG: DUF4293 family protein [Bacteroidales bacterium]|nr:DUF4293 family protein [Bacteroidales bacterium]
MFQRIQSLYIILAIIANILLFVFPMVQYSDMMGQTRIDTQINIIPGHIDNSYMADIMEGEPSTSIPQYCYFSSAWILLVLILLVEVLAGASLTLFKNRVIQMRVVAVAFLLEVAYIAIEFLWVIDAYPTKLGASLGINPTPHFTIGTWLPAIAAVLFFLAQRAIRSDEQKVRAADRLR